jgi:hypothetical protein
VTTWRLPAGADLDALAVAGGHLVLSGPRAPADSSPVAGAATTSGACLALAVAAGSPATIGRPQPLACDDPARYGVDVLPVIRRVPGTNRATLRLARVAPGVPGQTVVGPVEMRFSDVSDSAAEWVYGDERLWLYDDATTHGSELLEFSAVSGTLERRIAMPKLSRPLLAIDADGLWWAPSTASGFDGDSTPGLYEVTPAATAPIRVTALARAATFLVASGHSVWLDVDSSSGGSVFLRYDDGRSAPALRVATGISFDTEFADLEPSYCGDETDGLWTVEYGSAAEVQRIDPDTGLVRVVARVALADDEPPSSAIVDGDFYFLVAPPARGARASLVEVAPEAVP